MPSWKVTDTRTGRNYTVNGPTPPTERQLADLIDAAGGNPETLARQQGWRQAGMDTLGLALEAYGRPDEAVTGFAGGLVSGLRQGQSPLAAVTAGAQRGAAAFTEPLTSWGEGGQQENWNRVLTEAGVPAKGPLGVVPGTGIPRAMAGLGLDIALSPWNLVGLGIPGGALRLGATLAPKVLGATRGAETAAALTKAATVADRGLVGPLKAGVRELAARAVESPRTPQALKQLMPRARLATIPLGPAGETVGDLKKTVELRARGQAGMATQEAADLVTQLGVTEPELTTLIYAQKYPASKEAAQVAADPRLRQALTEYTRRSEARFAKDVAEGLIPERRLVGLNENFLKLVEQLDKAGTLPLVERALQGDAAAQAAVSADKSLQLLYRKVLGRLQRPDRSSGPFRGMLYQFADPATVKFERMAVPGRRRPALTATVETRQPRYVSTAGLGGDTSVLSEAGVSLTRNVRPSIAEARKATRTLAEAAEKSGITPRMDVQTLRRELSSIRAQADVDFLREAAKRVGSPTAAPGTRLVRESFLKELPESLRTIYQATHLPDRLVNEIEQTTARMVQPEHIERLWTVVPRLMKTMMTTYNVPVHMSGNLLGNITNMATEKGMSVPRAAQQFLWGLRLLTNKKLKLPTLRVTLPTAERHLINGQSVMVKQVVLRTREDYLNYARKFGVLGDQSADIAEAAGRKRGWGTGLFTVGGRYNPLNPDFIAAEKLRGVNQHFIEDPARVGLFFWHLGEGRSTTEASTSVVNRLFDYYDVSDAEKALRGPIPFYTWMRKNTGLWLRTLAEKPQYVARTKQALQSLWDLAEGGDEQPRIRRELIDEYRRTPEYVPLPRLPGLTDEAGNPILAKLRLPIADLRLFPTSAEAARSQLGEKLSPLVRLPLERFVTGEDIARGTPIDTRLVKAGTGAKLATALGFGPGIAEGPKGPMTTAEFEQLTRGLLPLPSVVRTTGEEGMGWPQEMALRGLGLAPAPLNQTMAERALAQQQRRRRAQQKMQQNLQKLR